MNGFWQTPAFLLASQVLIGAVWVFHGSYSKICNQIPRHRQIVARILGEKIAGPATLFIGTMEVGLGLWAWSGQERFACAVVQTLAIVAMNTLEIARATDLLISAWGMVLLNAVFLAVVWHWALAVR